VLLNRHKSGSASNLLLWSDITVMTTLSLSAVHCLNWKSSVTLSANHLFALELSGKSGEIRLDLHGSHASSSESQNQMEGGLLLDIVIREGSSIFELLSSEDESLLVWGDSFFVLDLSLDGFDRVGLLNFKSDSLSGEGLDEDLHTTTESEYEMEGRFLLDVVVLKGSSVFELLSSEDESLLVWGNSFLVLDLGLNGFNGVGLLNLQGNGLTSESLDEDLHSTSESQDKVKGRFLLDVVVLESTAILKLLTGEDKSLLIWGNTFLILDLSLDSFDGVSLFDFESDSLSCEGLHENMHKKEE